MAKMIDSNTQLGILSIGFVLLIDCFLRMPTLIALSGVSTRGLCVLPSTLTANAFIVTGSVCLSVQCIALYQIQFKVKQNCTKIPYFSIDNAHLMYNAHPNFFDIPFDV